MQIINKVAIYLRKSRGEAEDLEKHRNQLIDLCNKNGWKYDIYSEIGSSATLERPELSRLLSNIKQYNKVVVMALDRLSRDELGQIVITNTLKESNIEVVTPTKTYNFNDENDILMSDFEKLIARQEFRLIKKRLVTGKITSWKQGNWVQGFAPMPYVYNRETKSLDIDKDKLETWEEIKTLALKGYSSSIIGEKVGMNPLQIRRLLNNKTLLGYVKYQKEYIKGKHQPVITQEEWNIIQNYIRGRTNGTTRTKHKYPLTGLVKCKCGHSRTAVRRKDRHNKEVIAKCRHCGDSSLLSNSIHKSIIIAMKKFEDELIHATNNNNNTTQLKKLYKELKKVESDIDKAKKKFEKVKLMVLNDIIDIGEASKMNKDIKYDIEVLEERKYLIEEDIENRNVNTTDVISKLETSFKLLKEKNIEDEDKNLIYKTIIDKIIIQKKEVIEVVFK